MLLPWSAATLPEIMAGALQESKLGVLGGGQTGEQQASNQAALPEREGVECQKSIPSSGMRQLRSNAGECVRLQTIERLQDCRYGEQQIFHTIAFGAPLPWAPAALPGCWPAAWPS